MALVAGGPKNTPSLSEAVKGYQNAKLTHLNLINAFKKDSSMEIDLRAAQLMDEMDYYKDVIEAHGATVQSSSVPSRTQMLFWSKDRKQRFEEAKAKAVARLQMRHDYRYNHPFALFERWDQLRANDIPIAGPKAS